VREKKDRGFVFREITFQEMMRSKKEWIGVVSMSEGGGLV